MMVMQPTEARNLFPLTRDYIFFNHAGISPMSDRARAALHSLIEDMTLRPTPIDLVEEPADRLRRSLARLLHVPSETIAITRNTAHGLSLLAHGLDWQPGDNLVISQGDYPENVHPWRALAERGVELREAPVTDGRITPESVFSLVDERTRVISLSHVQHANGCRVDLAAIGRECDRRGIVFAVDAVQSAGAIELDLSTLPVDFLAAGACKWLMGPIGAGFCYCRPELLKRLATPLAGVRSTMHPRDFLSALFDVSDEARRIEESSVSPLDIVAFGVAVDLLLEVGAAAVERRVLSLSRRLGEGLAAEGFEVLGPWPREDRESSGIVSFRRPGSSPAEVVRDLRCAGIIGRIYPDAVRLSPHFYNTEAEVDRVVQVLAPVRITPS
jgi:selenocysteine lyase/cysteine desulfurase